MSIDNSNNIGLVFGASGEQGRAVVEGLIEVGFGKVYAFTGRTHDSDAENTTYLTDALGAVVWHGDLQNAEDIHKCLVDTRAQFIFLVTTTELPATFSPDATTSISAADAAHAEYQVIVQFFQTLKEVYKEDKLPRHVVYSSRDNVQRIALEELARTGEAFCILAEDGSIVPHYSAKGKGAEFAVEFLKDTPDLQLTVLTMPFLYSNFLAFFAPLPDEKEKPTQWTLCASLGDGRIDMMGARDLSMIIPNIFTHTDKYADKNIRLVGERLSMDEVASTFSDLYGKDVIYNPLTAEELATLPYATAMAQMCQYLAKMAEPHDLDTTVQLCFPRQPQKFQDWLLTHSESTAFQMTGLTRDAPEILSVVVFGATSPEGMSVIKGLLTDKRKQYTIRATTRHVDSEQAKNIARLDPNRIELLFADFDDSASCQKAAEGMDGAFLVTDFYEEAARDMQVEERYARNVIDACEAAKSIKHLVLCTMESVEEMNRELNLELTTTADAAGQEGYLIQFDAKARAAAYARTKKLSVTYVLLPFYTEDFFDMIERHGSNKLVLTVPIKDDAKVMCMSIEDLGPAVANIFDSYEVYAGHEVGLVTDFVTVKELRDVMNEVFISDRGSGVILETKTVSAEEWIDTKETHLKDFGQLFAYMAHSDAVKMRRSVAKTMKLVPSARPLREWIEQNANNDAFREKLGLR